MNRQWRLKKSVQGLIGPEHFEQTHTPIPELNDGEVLLKNLVLSFDPAQRTWLNKGSYMKQIVPGDVMKASTLMRVVKSKNRKFKEGDLVSGVGGWQEYVVTNGKDDVAPYRLPDLPGVPPSLFLSLFGTTGMTAYFGLVDVGKMKAGDVVLVSGAAGATGSVVGQLAKLMGAKKVIGVAGGAQKCQYCRDIGFDEVVDYKDKSVPLSAALRKACPKGVDIYFDNVGGEILEAALLLLRLRGRIVLCGGISQYNPKDAADVRGPRTYLTLIGARGRMEGFLVFDYVKQFPEAMRKMYEWHQKGLLKQQEDVREGFENIPGTLRELYTSGNHGKLLLKLESVPRGKL